METKGCELLFLLLESTAKVYPSPILTQTRTDILIKLLNQAKEPF